MRDKNRIRPFLNKLEELWLQYPDYRFGQIFNLLHRNVSADPFYLEENEWLKVINAFITCKAFGNPDGMDGSCVECSIEDKQLWRRCMDYKRNKINSKQ